MRDKKRRILLVMHSIPVDSGFLATKFIKLNERYDVHLLCWDKPENIDLFMETYRLPADFRKRIHLGNSKHFNIFKVLYCLLVCFFGSARVRRYLFGYNGALTEKLKFIIKYLPALFIHPAVVHFEFGTLAKQGLDLKQLTGAKLVASFRGYDLNYTGLDDVGYYKEVWTEIDAVHFLGADIKKRAVARGYVGSEYEALIPPGIDLKVFNTVVKASKFEVDTLHIVSVGRLVWKKGYEYAIRAVARLKEKNIPFVYYIIGDGPHRQALEFTVHELQLQENVVLCGVMNAAEVKNELSIAQVFLQPSISEGFSNAVVEAQAMGLPVICSDADGLPENVANNITGFVTPKWDAQAIADKLEWCWQHKDELLAMGKAGQQRVATYFTQEQQLDAFAELYNKLLSPA